VTALVRRIVVQLHRGAPASIDNNVRQKQSFLAGQLPEGDRAMKCHFLTTAFLLSTTKISFAQSQTGSNFGVPIVAVQRRGPG
jgi:hypothetical protein